MLHVAAITSDRDAALGGLQRIGIEIGILGEIHQLTVIFQTLFELSLIHILYSILPIISFYLVEQPINRLIGT